MARARRHEAASSDYVMASQDRLRRVAYALCGDWHLADDLLQEALTKLYLAWPRLSGEHGPDGYVRTILVRTSIDAHRGRQRRIRTVALGTEQDPADAAGTTLEERDALITALQALPEQQRRVVVLRHWLGLSVRETATELGINEGTVKSPQQPWPSGAGAILRASTARLSQAHRRFRLHRAAMHFHVFGRPRKWRKDTLLAADECTQY